MLPFGARDRDIGISECEILINAVCELRFLDVNTGRLLRVLTARRLTHLAASLTSSKVLRC